MMLNHNFFILLTALVLNSKKDKSVVYKSFHIKH